MVIMLQLAFGLFGSAVMLVGCLLTREVILSMAVRVDAANVIALLTSGGVASVSLLLFWFAAALGALDATRLASRRSSDVLELLFRLQHPGRTVEAALEDLRQHDRARAKLVREQAKALTAKGGRV